MKGRPEISTIENRHAIKKAKSSFLEKITENNISKG